MRFMDIIEERDSLIKKLEQVEDMSLLQAIKAVLHHGLLNGGTSSIEQYNREIEEAEARMEQGEFILHENAIKRIRGWRRC